MFSVQRSHNGSDLDNTPSVDLFEEALDVVIRRAQDDILSCPLLNDFAVAKNCYLVTQTKRLIQIVGNEHDSFLDFLLNVEKH